MYARQIELHAQPSIGVGGRLVLALLLSINLHLYLLYGLVPGPASHPSESLHAFDARIEPAQVADQSALRSPSTNAVSPSALSFTEPPRGPWFAPPRSEPDRIVEATFSRAVPLYRASAEPALPQPVPAPAPNPASPPHDHPTPLAPSLRYFTASEIDRYPSLLQKITPSYPPAARDNSGVVTLELLIDETGTVTSASVANADPPGMFDQSALDAFLPARFSPAQIAGDSVRSRILVKVRFAPTSVERLAR